MVFFLIAKDQTSQRTYCVFNRTRESFLSMRITPADTHWKRLKGLLGKLRLKADEGMWVTPSRGVHTFGVLFSVDLIYLDADCRVVKTIESFPSFRIGPLQLNCASVLQLATRTIYSSDTQVGDQLLICSPDEMQEYLKSTQGRAAGTAASA